MPPRAMDRDIYLTCQFGKFRASACLSSSCLQQAALNSRSILPARTSIGSDCLAGRVYHLQIRQLLRGKLFSSMGIHKLIHPSPCTAVSHTRTIRDRQKHPTPTDENRLISTKRLADWTWIEARTNSGPRGDYDSSRSCNVRIIAALARGKSSARKADCAPPLYRLPLSPSRHSRKSFVQSTHPTVPTYPYSHDLSGSKECSCEHRFPTPPRTLYSAPALPTLRALPYRREIPKAPPDELLRLAAQLAPGLDHCEGLRQQHEQGSI